jgi:phosphohistidine phosphatase
MQLLVVRHAIAEDREAYAASGRDDALRPLTARGARKMRRGARGLRELVPTIEVLVTSPLTRANETAEIIRRAYKLDGLETAPVLQPSVSLDDVVGWLSRFDSGVVAIVGHEPQLGHLVTCLLTGSDRSAVELKKGGACLIEFDERPGAGTGTLIWAVPPRTLRDLAG